MDAKLTLSFNREVVEKAKKYAASKNISLSRLIEHLLIQVTSGTYESLQAYPISDWVDFVAEGEVQYITKKTRKASKDEFFAAKK